MECAPGYVQASQGPQHTHTPAHTHYNGLQLSVQAQKTFCPLRDIPLSFHTFILPSALPSFSLSSFTSAVSSVMPLMTFSCFYTPPVSGVSLPPLFLTLTLLYGTTGRECRSHPDETKHCKHKWQVSHLRGKSHL